MKKGNLIYATRAHRCTNVYLIFIFLNSAHLEYSFKQQKYYQTNTTKQFNKTQNPIKCLLFVLNLKCLNLFPFKDQKCGEQAKKHPSRLLKSTCEWFSCPQLPGESLSQRDPTTWTRNCPPPIWTKGTASSPLHQHPLFSEALSSHRESYTWHQQLHRDLD